MSATDINRANEIPELQAIVFASHVLKTFKDNEARLRVLRGVCRYFGLTVSVVGPGAAQTAEPPLDAAALEELVTAAAASSQVFVNSDSCELAMAGCRG